MASLRRNIPLTLWCRLSTEILYGAYMTSHDLLGCLDEQKAQGLHWANVLRTWLAILHQGMDWDWPMSRDQLIQAVPQWVLVTTALEMFSIISVTCYRLKASPNISARSYPIHVPPIKKPYSDSRLQIVVCWNRTTNSSKRNSTHWMTVQVNYHMSR
jgi:hypothetical protein